MPALIVDALARSLGFVSHVNCKSGEDRTGFLRILCVIFLEKMRKKIQYDFLINADQYESLLKELWRKFKSRALLSNSITINALNAPGADGLQVNHSNVPSNKLFISRGNFRAKLHKLMYKKKELMPLQNKIDVMPVPGVFFSQATHFFDPSRVISRDLKKSSTRAKISSLFSRVPEHSKVFDLVTQETVKKLSQHQRPTKFLKDHLKTPERLLYAGVSLTQDTSGQKSSVIKSVTEDGKSLKQVARFFATDCGIISESLLAVGSTPSMRELMLQFEPIRCALQESQKTEFQIGAGYPQYALHFFLMGIAYGLKPILDPSVILVLNTSQDERLSRIYQEAQNLLTSSNSFGELKTKVKGNKKNSRVEAIALIEKLSQHAEFSFRP